MDCQKAAGTTLQLLPINIVHKGRSAGMHVFRNKPDYLLEDREM